jgi:hypothetical protein
VANQITWREAIAEQNARLGIKSSPKRVILPVSETSPQVERGRELGGRLRHISGEFNGLEKRYAAFLEQRRICGEILTWKFEAIKLKLAKATFYNPDFLLVMPDRLIELHETKAWMEDDAAVKIKVAAAMFPEFKIVLVKWNKNTKDWEYKNYG